MPIFNPPLVQEGGHEVNGFGDLLVTKTSILYSNRNPNMTQKEATDIENQFERSHDGCDHS